MEPTRASILSSKLTSITPHGINYGGFIDKIELDTKEVNIYVSDIKELNLFDIIEKREGRYYTISFFKNLDISAFYYRSGLIYKLKINPSAHSNWISFYNSSQLLWNIFNIYSLKVLRLDLTIDIREDFEIVNKGLLVKHKQSASEYNSKGLTGTSFGKGNEIFKVYNRKIKNKLPYGCTRIEIALKGKKLPSKHFIGIIKVLANHSEFKKFNPFKKIITNKLDIIKSLNSERFLMAKYQLEVITLLRFKKHHDKDRNYHRNFKNIIKVIPYLIQPSEIIETGLDKFFSNTLNEVKNELIQDSSLTIEYNKQQKNIGLLNTRSLYGN